MQKDYEGNYFRKVNVRKELQHQYIEEKGEDNS